MAGQSTSVAGVSPAVFERTTMMAAVFGGPQTVDLSPVPMPKPDRDQVRVKLEGCGVCASNLPAWQGRPWFNYPLEPLRPGT